MTRTRHILMKGCVLCSSRDVMALGKINDYAVCRGNINDYAVQSDFNHFYLSKSALI